MHPVWRRCSSVKYSRYSPSSPFDKLRATLSGVEGSRLARRAPRRPRCYAPIYEMGSNAGEPDERGRVLRTHASSAEQQPEELRDWQSKGEHDQAVSDPSLLARVVGDRPFSAPRLADAIAWTRSFTFAAVDIWLDPSRSDACAHTDSQRGWQSIGLMEHRGYRHRHREARQSGGMAARTVSGRRYPRRPSRRSSRSSPRVLPR